MKGLEAALAQYGALIEPTLDQLFPAENCLQKAVIDAARYSLLAGGKRIRPALLMEFYTLCGGEARDALPFACGLEMIHTYSLIHDDLPCMDDDDMRRGRPACHKTFGEATALLAGDALLNQAFEAMATTRAIPPQRVLRAMAYVGAQSGVHGMIGGQVIDLALEGAPSVPEAVHTTMVSLKTGGLFRAACVGGCLLAGADERRLEAAETFARAFGLVFQLTDDLLDETGDAALLGKPVGSDAASGKRTFVSVYGLGKSRAMVAGLLEEARAGLAAFPPSDLLLGLCDWLADREN